MEKIIQSQTVKWTKPWYNCFIKYVLVLFKCKFKILIRRLRTWKYPHVKNTRLRTWKYPVIHTWKI